MADTELIIKALEILGARILDFRAARVRAYDGKGYDVSTDFVVAWARPLPLTGGTEYGSHAGCIRHPEGEEPCAEIFWGRHHGADAEEALRRVYEERLAE